MFEKKKLHQFNSFHINLEYDIYSICFFFFKYYINNNKYEHLSVYFISYNCKINNN